MNQLTLYLYLADVLPSFALGIQFISVITVLFLIVGTLVMSAMRDKFYPHLIKWVVIPVFFYLSGTWVPEKKTIHLMAASEIGYQYKDVVTAEAKEFLDLIKARLKK